MVTEAEVEGIYPEIKLIESNSLQEKVIGAWMLVFGESNYDGDGDIPGLPLNTGAWSIDISNITHTRGVTNLSRNIAEYFNEDEGCNLNVDAITAGALCHDLGKYFEFTELDSATFINDVWQTSDPPIRHPILSAAVAWQFDFPRNVIHIIANHSFEGNHAVRNQEANIVHFADVLWWHVATVEETGKSLQEWLIEGRIT